LPNCELMARVGMAKFLQNLLGGVNVAVKFRQNFRVADERKIAKRPRCADEVISRERRARPRGRSRSSSP